MNKEEMFKSELGYIKNDKIKESAKTMINLLPDYFFHEAASSTGKYHPKYALGDGGLLRHTKAAVRFAYELLSDSCIGDKYTDSEKDSYYKRKRRCRFNKSFFNASNYYQSTK